MKARDLAVLALAFGAALFLRSWFVHDQVFVEGGVRFLATDPWYHVRLAENTAAHFPRVISSDPYLAQEGSREVPVAPLLAWLVAGIGSVLGDVARVAAWLPPIFGALTVIPLFFLARALWGDRGWIAPLLYSILPGQTLQRSLLGYADHHVLEMFFSTAALLFFIRALPEVELPAAQRRRVRRGEELPPRRFAVVDCALGGAALFFYLIAWRSGLFFVAVIAAAAVVTALVRRDREPLRIATAMFLSASAGLLLMAFLSALARRQLIGTIAAAASLVACELVLQIAWRQKRPMLSAMAGLLAVGAVGAGLLFAVQPQFARNIAGNLTRFNPGTGALFVGEVRPLTALVSPIGYLFSEAGALWILVVLAFIAVTGEISATRSPRLLAAITWALLIAIASVAQIRFLYYFGIVAAVMVIALVVRRGALAVAMLIVVGIGPVLPHARQMASRHDGANLAWIDALKWLRANTPEPFEDPRAYYADYDRAGAPLVSRSSVMAWWDFGYWILREGRRVPVANPTQTGVTEAARFFTAQDEESAEAIAARLNVDTVLVDDSITVSRASSARVRNSGTMPAMAAWAGQAMERYFERVDFRNPATGRMQESIVFYPEYFRTMAVRLMSYGGKAVTEKASFVAVIAPGDPRPRIVDLRRFATFDEASRFAAQQPNRRVVSIDPAATCVPIEALRKYRSVNDVIRKTEGRTNAVRVFRRQRDAS